MHRVGDIADDVVNGVAVTRKGLAMEFTDRAAGGNVVAASIHPTPKLDQNCLNENLRRADERMDNMAPIRRMTILGGDINRRPDTSGETALNGLEATPDCWYQSLSVVHTSACGGHARDRYYDAVWIYPGSGGGTNPTATSFCEQFTFNNEWNLGNTNNAELQNSCTDLGNNGLLDNERIDFIWTSYEDANGSPWKPGKEQVAPLITLAGTDVGLSLRPDTQEALRHHYADHRAVQALLVVRSATG